MADLDPTDGCDQCGTVGREHVPGCEADEPQADDHPYPHRGICRYCEAPVSQVTSDDHWTIRTLHGGYEECQQAPLLENGDPGRHHPRQAFSANGPVPDERH